MLPLPTGEPLENVNKEAYPSGHSEGRRPSRREEYPQREQDRETSKSIYIQDDKKQKTSKSITDMIMGNSYSNSKSSSSLSIAAGIEVVDTLTLVSQTQNRMEKALNGHYHYDSSLKDSQGFLFKYVNSKTFTGNYVCRFSWFDEYDYDFAC